MGLARADIDAVLAPLAEARPLPSAAYVDADVFALERRAIFDRSWICVGREEEIALPGQWIRAELAGGEAVLVARGPDLKVRAFFDVCRHRGASIVGRGACGRDARFECPYHGWTYELDGRGRAPLRSVNVEVWRGFVLIALSSDPVAIGESPPWLEQLPPLALGRRKAWTTKANWKFIAENFQETLHFPRVHAALEALTPAEDAFTWLGRGRWLGGTMNIERETVSTTGALDGRPLIGARGKVYDALLFPLLLTSLQPDYLLLYRLTPLSPSETAIRFDIWFHAAANRDAPAVYELWDRINAEDRAIVEDQQQNAGSRGFEPIGYEPVEEGVHAFDALVAKAYSP